MNRALLSGLFRVGLATFALLILVLSVPAQAAWQQQEFVIGTWLDPPITWDPDDVTTNARYYQVAADAYFNLLSGSPNPIDYRIGSRLTAAHATGLKVISGDRRFSGQPLYCRCPPPSSAAGSPWYDANVAVQVVADHTSNLDSDQRSALAGYNLGDEPETCSLADRHSWIAALRAADPDRLIYVNLKPGTGIGPPPVGCELTTQAEWDDYLSDWLDSGEPNERPDVASIALHPFRTNDPCCPNGINPNFLDKLRTLRMHLGTRPLWGWVNNWQVDDVSITDPNEQQMHFMAFAPIAYGAKGIIHFGFTHGITDDNTCTTNGVRCSRALVSSGITPTTKYRWAQTLNRYVRDIVGPIVMADSYLGVFHTGQGQSGWDIPAADMLVGSTPVLANFSNENVMVAVFESTQHSGTYHLLVVNKTLTPQFATISLENAFDVGTTLPVAGYVGSAGFSRLALNTTAFDVTLNGGEGRMFEITPPAANTFLTLTAPSGLETWTPQDQHVVSWTGASSGIEVRLYTDALEVAAGLSGPFVVLATGVSGSQTTITVPDVASRRARIEVRATDGRRASHTYPIRIGGTSPPAQTYHEVADLDNYLSASMALDAGGAPQLLHYGTESRQPILSKFNGTSWPSRRVYDQGFCTIPYAQCDDGFPEVFEAYGMWPALSHHSGNAQAVYYTVNNPGQQKLRYATQNTDSCWVISCIDEEVTTFDGNSALAFNGDVPYVAYNSGAYLGRQLVVRRRATDGSWEGFGEPYTSSSIINPHLVSAQFDGQGNLWVAGASQAGAGAVVFVMSSSGSTNEKFLFGTVANLAMSVDGSDNVHVAYTTLGTTPGSQVLRYLKRTGTTWSASEVVDGTLGTITGIALAVDGTQPRIAYAGNGMLKWASKSTSWTLATADGTHSSDGPVSLQIGSGGVRWISYFDRVDNELRVIGPPGACPIAETKTADGWRVENSLLGRTAGDSFLDDSYRLKHVPRSVDGTIALRIRENENEIATLDQVGLAILDHAPGLRAFRIQDRAILGTVRAAHLVVSSRNGDISAMVGGQDSYKGEPGETLYVQLSPRTAGSVLGSTRIKDPDDGGIIVNSSEKEPPIEEFRHETNAEGSVVVSDAEILDKTGILIQAPDGRGGWRTLQHYYPRASADDCVIDSVGSVARLVFVGRHGLGLIGQVTRASTQLLGTLPPQVANHSRLGSVGAAVSMSDRATTTLIPGDTLNLTFAAPPVPTGMVRDYFLVSKGSYTTSRVSALASQEADAIPRVLELRQNRPNPFETTTSITFALPIGGMTKLEIFDVQGRRVRVLANGPRDAGFHTLQWNRRADDGHEVTAGIYLYRLTAGTFVRQRKLALLTR